MLGDESTDPAIFRRDTLQNAAQRFGVERAWRMTKPELLTALSATGWRVEAELPHTAIREQGVGCGQPEGTCALCFRSLGHHGGPVPGRFGWPEGWRIQPGQY